MAESYKDQAKPLSPFSLNTRSDQPNEDDQYHHDQPKEDDQYHHNRTKCVHSRTKVLILCFGFIASLFLLIAVTFIVLSLTVFHLHSPNLTVDSISFNQRLDFVNGKVNTNQNATTVSMEISLRNPNPASLKVQNITISYHSGELVVGKTSRRSETIPAKRTVKMNLTAEIVTSKLQASIPGLNGRGVELRSSVVINGKLKKMKIFKKTVYLQTDCFMTMMTNNSLTPTFHCFRSGNA